jgi:hypothetical protein
VQWYIRRYGSLIGPTAFNALLDRSLVTTASITAEVHLPIGSIAIALPFLKPLHLSVHGIKFIEQQLHSFAHLLLSLLRFLYLHLNLL